MTLSVATGVYLVQHRLGFIAQAQTPPQTGDINQDGVVDHGDVDLCVNVVLEIETDPDIVSRCDINQDGEVNVLDVQLIVNMCTFLSCEGSKDINGDGVVDQRDVTLCENVFLGTETDPAIIARCDVNGDGTVDVLDIQLIINSCTLPSCAQPKATPTPSPPPGCYYEQVECIQAPCPPILVCPTPTIPAQSCTGTFNCCTSYDSSGDCINFSGDLSCYGENELDCTVDSPSLTCLTNYGTEPFENDCSWSLGGTDCSCGSCSVGYICQFGSDTSGSGPAIWNCEGSCCNRPDSCSGIGACLADGTATSNVPGCAAGSPPLTGDINGDSVVNILDFQILSNNFGTADPTSDLNGDGIVNILDFQILNNNFGKTSG